MENWAIGMGALSLIAALLAFSSMGAWAFMFLAVLLLLDGVMLLIGRSGGTPT
jgi:hypothetical protein